LPELPEVETVVRGIAPLIIGQTIVEARLLSRFVTRGGFEETARALRGTRIEAVERRGKHILITLDRGFLHLHLGMTGKLLWNAQAGAYTRAILQLSEGVLIYDDIRQFGRLEVSPVLPESVSSLGPDPLDIDFADFYERLKRRKGAIKPLLLNQAFLRGMGNIYTDEALFAAGIHPRATAQRISRRRAEILFKAIQELLRLAIEFRGSSVSDYVDSSGERGRFQNLHQVYGKENEPCPRCGRPIKRIVIAQRGTHLCPRCQRF
jgi:formamidopyrimidine-DNA glycosylase